jgi:RNA polymerase sigma factor (sigma-70 family)
MVIAARDGDAQALETLVAGALPLVYNIVGRALDGHADVDDVVQETLLRVVRGLSELRDPEAFRSWLVAIAVRQVRDLEQDRRKARSRTTVLDTTREPADPDADFVAAGMSALHTTARRRVVEQAARWLDPDDRALLALWWLEEIGELDRADVAAALGISGRHTAVRVLRMKEQMQISCMVVRAMKAEPGCHELREITVSWNGTPSPLWRKRVARHVRECGTCWKVVGDLLPVERVVRALPFLPLPADMAQRWTALGRHAAMSSPSGLNGTAVNGTAVHSKGLNGAQQARAVSRARPRGLFAHLAHGGLVPVSVSTAVVVAAVGAFVAVRQSTPAAPSAAVATPRPDASPSASPSASPTPTPTPSPSPSHSASPSSVPAAPVVKQVSSTRKGVGVWTFNGVDAALSESGAGWYYTWSTQHSGISGASTFVPMIWGPGSVTASALAQAKSEGPDLLGFNEPDMASQSNMSVSQALSLWPQLMSTGDTLGSPAVATGAATPGGWLDQFMSGAKARGYRVDFICLHWYGSDFVTSDAVSQLESYIQAVYNRYHLPIWLTEYALIDFSHGAPAFPTDQQQAAFVTASTQMLSSLSYMQRYAWFALPASDTAASSGLFRSGPVATAAGRAFEAAS